MKQFFNELWEFLIKNSALLLGLGIGMTAKIAIDSTTKKLTWRQIVIKVVIGFFCGYTAGRYLMANGMEEKISWVVPLSTMAGESVILWLTQNSWKIYRYAAKKFAGMTDNDLEDKK